MAQTTGDFPSFFGPLSWIFAVTIFWCRFSRNSWVSDVPAAGVPVVTVFPAVIGLHAVAGYLASMNTGHCCCWLPCFFKRICCENWKHPCLAGVPMLLASMLLLVSVLILLLAPLLVACIPAAVKVQMSLLLLSTLLLPMVLFLLVCMVFLLLRLSLLNLTSLLIGLSDIGFRLRSIGLLVSNSQNQLFIHIRLVEIFLLRCKCSRKNCYSTW